MATVLKVEIDAFQREKENLLAEHEHEYVLIHGSDIVDTFTAEEDAIRAGYRCFGNVPFLVKKIERFETPLNFTSLMLGA